MHSLTTTDFMRAEPVAVLWFVLKKAVLWEHPLTAVAEASMTTLGSVLRHFVLTDGHLEVLHERAGPMFAMGASEPGLEGEMRAMLEWASPPNSRVTIPSEVRKLANALFGVKVPLVPRHSAMLTRHRGQMLYDLLCPVARGQLGAQEEETARRITADLVSQMSKKEGAPYKGKDLPARLLLQGSKPQVVNDLAQALASALALQLKYHLVEIDCADYANEGEADSWVGGKSYWQNSTPGLVTAPLSEHKHVVYVIKNLERAHSSVPASLIPALADGVLRDHHGGTVRVDRPKAVSEPLSCSRAVFIFTTTAGSAAMRQPKRDQLLGGAQYRQHAYSLFAELRRASKVYKGATGPAVNGTLLGLLEHAHHPVSVEGRWGAIADLAAGAMRNVLPLLAHEMNADTVRWNQPADAVDLAHILLLTDPDPRPEQAAPAWLVQALLVDWMAARFECTTPRGKHAVVGIRPAAQKAWVAVLDDLGDEDPAARLRTRRQRLLAQFEADESGWWLVGVSLQTDRPLADFRANGLTADVPNDRLADIVGQQPVKQYLEQMVWELRQPQAGRGTGVLTSRGVLLYGAPGTGKTMLARALAGEAQLPFIATTGTQLLRPGAVDDVFEVALRHQPCIVFVDEVDVLGRRGTHGAVHDAAINQLLVRLDGFEHHSTIRLVLATNRPDQVDPALVRPGRVDGRFEVGPPDSESRMKWLTQHLLPWMDDSDGDAVERLTRYTQDWTGAELAQLLRECLKQCCAGNRRAVVALNDCVLWTLVRQVKGLPEVPDELLRRIAVHECGHALVQSLLEPGSVARVSVVGHGDALGLMLAESKKTMTVTDIQNRLAVLLAGRAAEELVYGLGQASAGGRSDLLQATQLAQVAVTEMGADEEFGLINLKGMTPPSSLLEQAGQRVGIWLWHAREKATALLSTHRPLLQTLTAALLDSKVLLAEDVVRMVQMDAMTTSKQAMENQS